MKGEAIALTEFRVGNAFTRGEIARAGGVREPQGSRDPHWSTGIVEFDNATLLLVTLEKDQDDYQYEDHFDGQLFWWQSQNRQTPESRVIADLISGVRQAHLFVRIAAKEKGKAAPFVFCGQLSAPAAEGEHPVTCMFDVID